MSNNGRRRWRRWLRNERARGDDFGADIGRFRGRGAFVRRHRGMEGCSGSIPETLLPLPAKPFTPRSLVGMTMGARKRRACAMDARIDRALGKIFGGSIRATAPNESERHRFRIGERLRPCKLCRGLEAVARCAAGHGFGLPCVFCEPCGTRKKINRTPWPECDGSGVIATRMRCPGDKHFLIAERRWIPVPSCRLCNGKGSVKLPLDRSSESCPGCCNCAVGVCKKLDPDGVCAEDFMHCEDWLEPARLREVPHV